MSARHASEALATARYLGQLARFLRRPLHASEARFQIETMRGRRAQSFLALLERGVYANPRSPYRALLARAAIGADDVARAVRRDGVEGALERLYEAGVTLSLEEFKGRRPIVRPGLELHARPEDFDNPLVARVLAAQTGGSRSAPRRVFFDLGNVAHETAHLELMLEGLGAEDRPQAGWFPPPPSIAGIKWVLRHAKRGRVPERWFAQRPVTLREGNASYAGFTAATYATARMLGLPLPWPRHTPPAEAHEVARWLGERRRQGSAAVLRTYPSSAVRVCQAVRSSGLDIDGTTFSLVGEPCTPAKLEVMAAAGCAAVCTYFITEAGQIATACTAAAAPDDMHVLEERVVLNGRPREGVPGQVVNALFVTTLDTLAPKVLLNVETGDHGVLERIDCGCPEGSLGLHQHVHTVRNHEKLVGEGMNFLSADLVELIEEVLPSRFGGDATDYQLVEREQDGISRVLLLVHPRVGELDEQLLTSTVIDRLGARRGGDAMMAEVWRTSGTLRVLRREPHLTPAGKVAALHVDRGTDAAGAVKGAAR